MFVSCAVVLRILLQRRPTQDPDWTDTNDPGITILEALVYAFIDLGYRCSSLIRRVVFGSDRWPP